MSVAPLWATHYVFPTGRGITGASIPDPSNTVMKLMYRERRCFMLTPVMVDSGLLHRDVSFTGPAAHVVG